MRPRIRAIGSAIAAPVGQVGSGAE